MAQFCFSIKKGEKFQEFEIKFKEKRKEDEIAISQAQCSMKQMSKITSSIR